MAKINLEPYKGVRDFYPEDKRLHRHIFKIWEKVAESYGYEKYDASILEPLDLYKSKSSEEIISEQIYAFVDRGDREVALRPEMTPTVARMIATKWQEIPSPARWYSIPNLFRYEKPQRGRLREHWQLNCDLFGVKGSNADAEIISLAFDIMKTFGAKSEDFVIKINSRKLINDMYERIGVDKEQKLTISRIIDKKEKISGESFKDSIKEVIGEGKLNKLSYLLDSGETFLEEFSNNESAKELKETFVLLRSFGIKNIVFSPTILRGFDYYTGIIFEVFDTNPENTRSIFGGGRYDNLVGQFGNEQVPAVGFGMGDVTIHDFLTTHNLWPKINSETDLWICLAPMSDIGKINEITKNLREKGVNVGVDISGKKLTDQLKSVEKRGIPFVMVVGKDEIENNKFKIRNVETREEKEISLEEIVGMIN